MKTLIAILIFVSSASAQEITKKQLDDAVQEIPNPAGGFISKEVSKVQGFYRNGELVLLKHHSVTTVNTPSGSSESESTYYFLVAEGRKVMRIDGVQLAPTFVASPWPIHITHVNGAGEFLGDVRYNVSIPDIGFFEYLEFEDGKLLRLLEGKQFDEFRKINLEGARRVLTESPNRAE